MADLKGIHHITAIAGEPQRNVDFYTALLGLRLVKRTVNFDDPGTYHLYYGDETGSPGTLLTFFPWAGAERGVVGAGQMTSTAFSVPEGALSFWLERLERAGAIVDGPAERFGEEVLTFADPDGMTVEIVAHAGAGWGGWSDGPIPREYAIRGFRGVTFLEANPERTDAALTGDMGFKRVGEANGRTRYTIGPEGLEQTVDIMEAPGGRYGRMGVGIVHHIAWRVESDAEQLAWKGKLEKDGYRVTPVQDRQYFNSIYFREPGGVLFEIATDPPGMLIDESVETLGSHLKLPPWYESHRAEIEAVLPPLHLPDGARIEA